MFPDQVDTWGMINVRVLLASVALLAAASLAAPLTAYSQSRGHEADPLCRERSSAIEQAWLYDYRASLGQPVAGRYCAGSI